MEKSKRISLDIIVYLMMIIAVIFATVQSLLGHNNDTAFKLILGIWILSAVIISDFVEPVINKSFHAMDSDMIKKYAAYAVTDAAAYVFIYVFVINVGLYSEKIHYIFLGAGILFFIIKMLLFSAYKKDMVSSSSIKNPDSEELRCLRFEKSRLEIQENEDDDGVKVFVINGKNLDS